MQSYHIQNRSRLKRPPLPILEDTSRGLLSRSQSLEAEFAPPGNRQPEPIMATGSWGYCDEVMVREQRRDLDHQVKMRLGMKDNMG